ncbi:NitT/TauT family transport system substrate-binding protein [Hathewaya proteolytica DSM 3090]|uniref:NitT/TauT family transport system substrate-binding protein n=1 Tax=Hathewaya proteolytica DSM 3090 TaxID=1121331 RepID=A0A1M6SNT1_9CLOT|nr:ABC transporter substrate-binding protein [Hathewaya proteolytica]SHK46353.1 NitT/TauT family transport system substrate-binding protein [Hathewaya proteolytica DSM 3090]
MKKLKKVLSVFIFATFLLCGCSSSIDSIKLGKDSGDKTSKTDKKAKYKISVAAQATSGQVFQYMAEKRGYLEEEDVEVEMVYINNGTDAFSALSSGQVDVISTYGTGGPLIQIANGQEFTVFGGYMIIGETPAYGLPGTKWEKLEDFKGKKIGIMRGGTPDVVLKGVLYDAGLYNDVTFVEFKKNPDVLQAVRNGEVDFGATSTGFQVQAAEMGLEVKMWPDDFWPNHSCCRMLSKTTWLEKNPEAIQALLRAYLRAEEDMHKEGGMDEVVDLVVKNLDLGKKTVESFVKSPHMLYDSDPYVNSVIKMWNKMNDFGYIKDTNVKIEDHVENQNYKKALDDLIKRYPDSKFFKDKLEIYNTNNSKAFSK